MGWRSGMRLSPDAGRDTRAGTAATGPVAVPAAAPATAAPASSGEGAAASPSWRFCVSCFSRESSRAFCLCCMRDSVAAASNAPVTSVRGRRDLPLLAASAGGARHTAASFAGSLHGICIRPSSTSCTEAASSLKNERRPSGEDRSYVTGPGARGGVTCCASRPGSPPTPSTGGPTAPAPRGFGAAAPPDSSVARASSLPATCSCEVGVAPPPAPPRSASNERCWLGVSGVTGDGPAAVAGSAEGSRSGVAIGGGAKVLTDG